MKRNKPKTPQFKKPFVVLNRRKIAGWAIAIFFLCAWMFVLGVLVGRNKAPLKFDIQKLQQKLDDTKQHGRAEEQAEASTDTVIVKDKTKLGFYERLPEDQKDVSIPDLKSRQTVKRKEEKKVAAVTKKQPSAAAYTIQAASVKNAKDADRLVARLKKEGYPAYRAVGNVPGKGVWFRVRIGEYNSKVQARRTLDKLKKLGLKPILVKK